MKYKDQLTMVMFNALVALDKPMAIRELSRKSKVVTSKLQGHMPLLVRHKIVALKKFPKVRGRTIFLTKKGEELRGLFLEIEKELAKPL